MTEAEIQSDIIKALKESPLIRVWRANAGSSGRHNMKLGPAGLPDLIGYLRMGPLGGKFIGFEVKGPKGKLRDTQAAFEQDLLQAGGFFFCVRSTEETLDIVEELCREAVEEV